MTNGLCCIVPQEMAFTLNVTVIQKPLKMKVDPNEHQSSSIHCDSQYGPTFGGGCDFHVTTFFTCGKCHSIGILALRSQ